MVFKYQDYVDAYLKLATMTESWNDSQPGIKFVQKLKCIVYSLVLWNFWIMTGL